MSLEDLYAIYTSYNSICTDSRKLKKNDLFFALKGESFNGNTFAKKALIQGASFCVIDDSRLAGRSHKYILVDDVLETLQKLASYHRNTFNFPIIALTGSNGKTTTKELIYNVLSSTHKVNATKGNLNNHIGVPLTLLSFEKNLDYGIVEMGANHQKEIEFLVSIVRPDYGIITNFGKAHLEGFGSVEGVIKGKSELYDYLKTHRKTIFINTEDSQQLNQIGNYKHIVTFGFKENNHSCVTFENANPFVRIHYNNTSIDSQLIGDYNFGNIAAAIAIGEHFNISPSNIQKAIASYKPTNNRSEIIEKNSNKIILDAYNANPTSMLAALRSFKQLDSDNKFLFIGDMFELGKATELEHQAITDFVERHFKSNVYLIGEHFFKTKTKDSTTKFSSFAHLKSELHNLSIKNATLLIKGSRGMALERILEDL
jgi:UDP-N-acetylmuramoyl-tripeptide--D-alanyl-D-alanine ligase